MVEHLSSQERQKVQELSASVAERLQADAALKQWCTDATIERYLRARNWDFAAALKMLNGSLDWRSSYKPHEIRWEDIQEEAKAGKSFIQEARDREGRPIIIMRPRNENSNNVERQIKFVVYTLEMASRKAERAGVGKMTWLIDFVGYTLRNAPPIKVSLHTTHLLQNHFPERLGLAVCFRPPRLFSLTYKATKPFIDPVTKRKLLFVEDRNQEAALMAEKFDMDLMEECLGGRSTHQFDFESYGADMRHEDAELQRQIEACRPAGATSDLEPS